MVKGIIATLKQIFKNKEKIKNGRKQKRNQKN